MITREEKKKDREIENSEKKEFVFIHWLNRIELELQLNRGAKQQRKTRKQKDSLCPFLTN